MIRSSKKKYYENCIEENHSNPKCLWKVLKKLTDGQSKVAPPNKLTAVHFNQYFSSIGSTTISHLLTTDDNNTENAIFWRGSNCTSRFDFMNIHLEAVMKQLFALGNTSNNDVLGFDSKLLFLGAEIIAPILTKFYNASLTNRIVISDWKVSKVTPIYKGKGNKEEAGNYRPISLIGHVMKIFEKEIKTQLMVYLEINDLITIDQSAYRQQHNTQTALHRVIDDWLCNMSDGNIHEWYDQNKLVINKSKSSVMLATTRQRILHINDNNLDVHIGDYKLVQSDCIDYLGVKIDETISWNKQTDNICKKNWSL